MVSVQRCYASDRNLIPSESWVRALGKGGDVRQLVPAMFHCVGISAAPDLITEKWWVTQGWSSSRLRVEV